MPIKEYMQTALRRKILPEVVYDTLGNLDGSYKKVDQGELNTLRTQNAWITEPIYRASDIVLPMPFFEWVERIRSPLYFKPAAVQLFHHSATFPKG
jgi:hypothetical protein